MSEDGEPLEGAVARVYIRRNASPHSLERLRDHLAKTAKGAYAFGSFYEWTSIEVTDRDDLDLIRAAFKPLIDGWRELP